MKFLMSALGSAGDVHPFIAIGEVLLACGHEVRIIASPRFEERIRRAGLAFAPLGTADDFERVLQRPELWDPRGGARLILDELLQRLPEGYAATERHEEHGHDKNQRGTLVEVPAQWDHQRADREGRDNRRDVRRSYARAS